MASSEVRLAGSARVASDSSWTEGARLPIEPLAARKASRPSGAAAADSNDSVRWSADGESVQLRLRCRPPVGGNTARHTSWSRVPSSWVEYNKAEPSGSHA